MYGYLSSSREVIWRSRENCLVKAIEYLDWEAVISGFWVSNFYDQTRQVVLNNLNFRKSEQENNHKLYIYIYNVAKLKLQLTIPQASWSPYYFKISCCAGKAQVLANQTSALWKIQRLANMVAGTRENRTPIINMWKIRALISQSRRRSWPIL